MYSLLKSVPGRQLLAYEAPSLAGSIVIAEVFYKFHSFTLETLCFLATWCVLSAVVHAVNWLFKSSVSNGVPAS